MPSVYRELCLLLGEEGGVWIDISLFGIEKEGIGMVQNVHIYKHLNHL